MGSELFAPLAGVGWLLFMVGAAAVFIGAVVQGSVGLGLGMVAGPVLMMINPQFVPAPLLVLSFLVSILVAYREWREIDKRGLFFSLLGRIPGSIIAGFTIAIIPTSLYNLIFGVIVLVAILFDLAGWRISPTMRNLFIAGTASGYMGTLTSIGASPMALVYSQHKPSVLRSTLAVFFMASSAISIITLHFFGKFHYEEIFISAGFIPPLVAGYWASSYIVTRFNPASIRNAVLVVSALSGVALIIKYVIFVV